MDHDATREQLELAALEPGGLDRLMAGDTAASQAVAAHLAGCPSCSDELARLSVVSNLVREAVRELPAPGLRDLILSAIRSGGVARSQSASTVSPVSPVSPASPVSLQESPLPLHESTASPAPLHASPVSPVSTASRVSSVSPVPRSGRPSWGWVATIAAIIAVSVVTTTFIVGGRADAELAAQADTVAALEEVITATDAIDAQPDAENVTLSGTTDPTVEGSLDFSPSTTQLVVVATGLTPPPAGQEYRCWVQSGGVRQRVGRMFFSTDLAYWVGSAPVVAGLSGAAVFGVSLVDVAGPGVETDPVLLGAL